MNKIKEIVSILSNTNKTISTMESCTGGSLVNAITNIPGASKVIKFSAITYSNEYKIKMGVDEKIINKYTVYSVNTAIEMSKQIANYTNSNFGIGITGKLNKTDENNPCGKDMEVFFNIFDKDNNINYSGIIEVISNKRAIAKKEVINKVIDKLYEIIKKED